MTNTIYTKYTNNRFTRTRQRTPPLVSYPSPESPVSGVAHPLPPLHSLPLGKHTWDACRLPASGLRVGGLVPALPESQHPETSSQGR